MADKKKKSKAELLYPTMDKSKFVRKLTKKEQEERDKEQRGKRKKRYASFNRG